MARVMMARGVTELMSGATRTGGPTVRRIIEASGNPLMCHFHLIVISFTSIEKCIHSLLV